MRPTRRAKRRASTMRSSRFSDVRRRSVARYEQHVRKLDNRSGFIDLFWPGVLIVEQKSAGRDLDPRLRAGRGVFRQPCPRGNRPRYILVSDFQTFALHDLDEGKHTDFSPWRTCPPTSRRSASSWGCNAESSAIRTRSTSKPRRRWDGCMTRSKHPVTAAMTWRCSWCARCSACSPMTPASSSRATSSVELAGDPDP